MQLNQEICSTLKSPGIVTVDKVYALEWHLYFISMDGERTVKYLLEGNLGGRREKGRPWLRWMDNVELDLRNMGG